MLAKRAEILFYYDARLSNPNGDPDENRPRIDRVTGKNYVTEFRLKRTIRDYLDKVNGKRIFMRAELVSPKGLELKLVGDLASEYITGEGKQSKIQRPKLIADHIDIRLFGILFPVAGTHFKQVGPVQFSIGQSLNSPVEVIEIRMTRVVPTRKGAEAGTFGDKTVVRYSFIQFHGFVNNHVSKDVNLTEDDVIEMLTAMWRGTTSLSTSSKFGQQSRLLLKINYKDDGYIGDLDLKSTLETSATTLENISQVILNIKNLLQTFSNHKNLIESIEYEYSPELVCSLDEQGSNFENIIQPWASKADVKVKRLNL